MLTRYGVERLLYRLGRTSSGERFVLKGAVLFYLWDGAPHRPTRDVDFLAYGDVSHDAIMATFRVVCSADVEPDGLAFHADSIRVEPIRDQQEYGGIRVTLVAMLGTARIPLQIDIGVGDAVTPDPRVATFPTLLDLPAPRVRAYPAETVIAEKFQAMVALGIANTRMKDFYDVWLLSEKHQFDGVTLASAIAATFARRGTPLPADTPLALSEHFAHDQAKQAQWQHSSNEGGCEMHPPTSASFSSALVRSFSQQHEPQPAQNPSVRAGYRPGDGPRDTPKSERTVDSPSGSHRQSPAQSRD